MELTILGSGTYQPEYTRHAAGYLVKIGRQKLVFDFGRGTLDQLLKAGVAFYDIDAIFISHFHTDHFSDLAPFFHVALAPPIKGKKRTKDLLICGPQGTRERLNFLFKAFGFKTTKIKYRLIIKELKNNDSVKNKNWLLKSYLVQHFPHDEKKRKSLAYRLEVKKKIFAYSGDTQYCSNLKLACKNADLAVIEASCPQKLVELGHMTGELAGKVAQEAMVKKLILTHLIPYYLKNFNPVKEARKFYKGPVLIAKDLMRIKI